MPGHSRQRGFTLFEIIIAVSIFAVIGVMSMNGLIQVGRSTEQVSEAQRQLSAIQFAISYLGKDLTQLVGRKIRDQYGDEQSQLQILENALVFTRNGWSNLLQQPRSNQQRVAYLLDDDKLIRRYWPELDQAYSERKVDQVLLDGVNSMSYTLLTRGTEKYQQWPPDETSGNQPQIPVALEFEIDLKGFGTIQRVFELPHVEV